MLHTVYDFNKTTEILNKAALLQNIDTASADFKKQVLQQSEYGIKPVFICAVSRYNESDLFISMIVSIPRLMRKNDTGIIQQTAAATPIAMICDAETLKPSAIIPLDIDWKEDETNFEYPAFGQNIFNGITYIAHTATQDYKGEILSGFDSRTLKRTNRNPAIYHKPFANNTGIPMTTFFHFINEKDNCFVDNRKEIYNVLTGQLLLDASQYLKDINYIMFFAPLNTNHTKWFINYADTSFIKDKNRHTFHSVIIDQAQHKVLSNNNSPNTVFNVYGNKIISIEERDNGYYFVSYEKE